MIDVQDGVRKQIALYRAYDIRAHPEQRSGRGKEGKLSYGPYLLISREKGADGSAVGQLAGKRLRWLVFDKEIVDAIAQKARVRRELIQSVDERLKAARVVVEGSDRERTRPARRQFGQNACDPLNQDMTINTVELTVEAATEVVIAALQRKLAVHLKGRG